MKESVTKSPVSPVPRLNSLLHRLQHLPAQDGESCLDQLMIFLDNPPADTGDRWRKAAEMCAAWGISCSHTSVWRLFRSYAVEWRARLAMGVSMDEDQTPEELEDKATHMIALRTCEILTDPGAAINSLISLARIDLRKKALEFARQKHADEQRTPLQAAFAVIEKRAFLNWHAQFAIDRLKEALERPRPSPFFKKFLNPTAAPPDASSDPHAPHA